MANQLHNIFNRQHLLEKLQSEKLERRTYSFYQYANLKVEELQDLRDQLYQDLDELRVLGRIYIAAEGINAQISIPKDSLDQLKQLLADRSFTNEVNLNEAVEEHDASFLKLKISIRNKIVADGLKDSSFDVTRKGEHIDAEKFNALANSDETVIVDMRNHYETEIGHFQNAICPDVDTFREALPLVEKELEDQKDKNLVMYCTGGIRCEKASAYYRHKGFKNVYQLKGGIIQYARDVKEKGLENKFIGKNFVFDERLAERITDDVIARCHQCGTPCDTHTNCENEACNLLFIQCEECKEQYKGCCSDTCETIIELDEDKQREIRKIVGRQNQGKKSKRFAKGRIEKRKDMQSALQEVLEQKELVQNG